MARNTTTNTATAPAKAAKTKPPVVSKPEIPEEETNSYEEQLNQRIDPKQPEGGAPPDETPQDEPTKAENTNSQEGHEDDQEPEGETKVQLSDDVLDLLSGYVAAYPDNDVFHITSDGQVFLDRNKTDAITHEKTLGGKLKSYTV